MSSDSSKRNAIIAGAVGAAVLGGAILYSRRVYAYLFPAYELLRLLPDVLEKIETQNDLAREQNDLTRQQTDLTRQQTDLTRQQNDLARLMLTGQCKPTSSTSTKEEESYRKRAMEYYYGTSELSVISGVEGMMRCMVSGGIWTHQGKAVVKAAHVYQKNWNTGFLMAMNKKINDPSNIIFMRSQIEDKLDKFEISIIPSKSDFKLVVLKKSLLDSFIGSGNSDLEKGPVDTMKWRDLDGKSLDFTGCLPNKRPSRRLAAFHSHAALQHAKTRDGWLEEYHIPCEGWTTPGWDEKQMDQWFAGHPQLPLTGKEEGESLEGEEV